MNFQESATNEVLGMTYVVAFEADVYSQCRQYVWVCELLVTTLVVYFLLADSYSNSFPNQGILKEAGSTKRTTKEPLVLKPHVFE